MPEDIFPNENDAVLLPFLSAESEAVMEDCLNRLFEEIVIPQIHKVLISYLTLTFDEKDEIQSDAQTRILKALRKLRAGKNPIKNFQDYISTVTFNCRKDFILSKQPEWRRIDNRLRRMRDGGELFFFGDDAGIQFVCLHSPHEKPSKMEFDEIIALICQKHPNHLFLKTQILVPIILKTAEGALAKKDVIKIILEVTETARFKEVRMPGETSEILNFDENEYVLQERHQKTLRLIWNEIIKFPPNQRKVLLLGLRESSKVEAVTLFLQKRIATIEEIAAALDLSLAEFSSLFARLPLSSSEIADFLGIEAEGKTSKEQRVDNLRKAGRKLLKSKLGIRE